MLSEKPKKKFQIRDSTFEYENDYENDTKSFNKKSSLHNSSKNHKDGLSSHELKNKLIQVVKNKGIFDSMKSQLRNKLVLELNPNLEQLRSKAAENLENQRSKSNLALNTINCLLINHLKTNEYDYTLSVFMPECGINLNDAFSLSDILHILKVSPQSKLYQEISNSQTIKSKGLLWYLVNYFCSHYVTNEAGTQTDYDGVHNIASNLGLKLKNLDQFYSDKSDSFKNKLSFEDKIVAYQKRIEEKCKLEFDQKFNEFKEIELARMRIEEREKLRIDMHNYRQTLEHTYSKRNEMLNQKEKTLDDVLKQRKELEEREIYLQRQHLLDEMKQLREKEAEFKRNVEAQTKFLQIDATKYQKLEEELKIREEKLKQSQEELEVRLRDEKERIKLDLERTYAQREFILQSIDVKNKQDATQNEIEKAHLDRIRHEFQMQQIRLNEMDLELQKAQGESICLRTENELIKEKLSHCMDYEFIVQENKMLKHKLELSKEIIGEKHLSSRRSQARSSIPGTPTAAAGFVPQRKRSVTFASEAEPNLNNPQIPMLNLRTSNNFDENSAMQATEIGVDQLPKDNLDQNDIDYEEKSRATYREEGERILDDVVERSEIKEKIEHHGVVNEELRDLFEMQIFEQRKLYETINDVKKQVEFLFNGVKNEEDLSKVTCPVENTSLEFIETAKDRLKYLENESERIEQTYRDYQHKIKSKYYPINDDEEKEIRVVAKAKLDHDPLDIERFMESTLKATMNAKVMRDELEAEYEKLKLDKSIKEKLPDMKSIEEFIKSVPISSNTDHSSIKDRIKQEENELKLFQAKNRTSSMLSDQTPSSKRERFTKKATIYSLEDDSSVTNEPKPKTHFNPYVEDDRTLDDKSFSENVNNRFETRSPVKKNFNLNEYKNMFDEKTKEEDKSYEDDFEKEENMGDRKRLVKIEYSESSSEEENKKSINKKENFDDSGSDDGW